MRKVAVDRGPLTSGHAVRGVGAYTRELIKALEQESERVKELKIKAVDFKKADLSKYDLVHYPYFNPYFVALPLVKLASARGRLSSGQKVVVTIHDLIPLIYPKHYPPGIRGRMRYYLQKYLIKNVDGIITVSETSKKDIVRFLGIPEERIKVIYEAPRRIFKPITNHKSPITTKRKYNLPTRFVLYVGDVNYNKNILGLIKACKIAKVKLVIVGKQALEIEEQGLGLDVLKGPKDWFRFLFNIPHPELAHYNDLLEEFRSNGNIIRTGFVPDDDLVAIYNLATVYCQPSYYEGFGLPVLEAMASGTPVVAAKTQALVEIAEKAAQIVNPDDPKDIAEKITKLMKSAKLRTEMANNGYRVCSKYSWKKTASQTSQFYRQILEE